MNGAGGVRGNVGPWKIDWKSMPKGPQGEAEVEVAGKGRLLVRWRKDNDGIWIELPHGVFGFDIDAELNEEGRLSYWLMQRLTAAQWANQAFVREGEAAISQGDAAKKRGVRIRAQMPGKMIRVLATVGAEVEKGQSLGTMEAMKMENDIKAPQGGRIAKVLVSAGQTVETGADLFTIEPV